ncbi:MAG: HlyD family efflux transporter periplasmic adaptor subunit [Ignavibacteria bacterium]|nr:HlyD family efflux transporter periplasmic adaptor subunit [Ignavibacteria bacterium]
MRIIRPILILTILLIFGCSNSNDSNQIETSGTIEASEVEIRTKVAGELIDIEIKEGEKVSTGDVIALIDDSDLQIQKAQAVAALNLAKAKYQTVIEGTRPEDKAQLEEFVKQAQLNYDNAKQDFERAENLFKSQSVSQKIFDDAKLRVEVAEAQFTAAKENLKKAVTGARQSEINAAKAAVEQANAAVDATDKRISDAIIKSPINGFSTLMNYEKGEIVNTGAVLTRVVDLQNVWTKIFINEIDLGKIHLNQEVIIKVDSFKDRQFKGRVSYISPEAEFTPKNIQTKEERVKLVYAVKVSINNDDLLLKQGMQCDVLIK